MSSTDLPRQVYQYVVPSRAKENRNDLEQAFHNYDKTLLLYVMRKKIELSNFKRNSVIIFILI